MHRPSGDRQRERKERLANGDDDEFENSAIQDGDRVFDDGTRRDNVGTCHRGRDRSGNRK